MFPNKDKNGINIIFVYADSKREWNCSQWRSLTPSDAINRSEKHNAKLIHVTGFEDYLNPVIQEIVAPADIIIFQRNLIRDTVFDAMHYWQGMTKPVLIDLDDAYHILPWSNPAHKFWMENEEIQPLEMLEYGISISDGLIAPNRILLNDWSHVAQGYYLQNFAEKKWWDDLPSREESRKELDLEDKIVIGWGGSVSHYDSWHGSGLIKAAKSICDRHNNVVFMICGNDRRMYDHLDVPSSQKYLQEGVAPNVWPHIVKRFDIGVAPLFGPYDQRRSWIKGLEYMLASVPWIATTGEPYRDIAEYGTLVDNGSSNWEDAIENMISNIPDEHERMSQVAILSTQWYADNQIDTFAKVYERAITDFRGERSHLPNLLRVHGEGSTVNVENVENVEQVEKVEVPSE